MPLATQIGLTIYKGMAITWPEEFTAPNKQSHKCNGDLCNGRTAAFALWSGDGEWLQVWVVKLRLTMILIWLNFPSIQKIVDDENVVS